MGLDPEPDAASATRRCFLVPGGQRNLTDRKQNPDITPTTKMLNMSQRQTLRALVNDRLSAAAEEIFVLFERIIVDYEQQVCIYKEESQRKQGLLDSALAALGGSGSQIQHSFGSGPAPKNQKIQETPQMDEEAAGQSVRRESEPVLTVPEFRVCVTREGSVFHQRQAEHRQETGQDDTNTVSQPGHFSNADEDWESPFSWSVALMNAETNGLHYNQFQIRSRSAAVLNSGLSKYKTTPEMNSAGNNGHMSLINQGTEKPFSCSTCKKTFTRKSTLKLHMRTHTGEKLFSCSICQKTFTRKSSLESHRRIHTGEKPFSCFTCKKTFVRNSALKMHIKTHKYLICKQISQHVPLQ